MQKGHVLQFHCISCKNPVQFSIFELDQPQACVTCNECKKIYSFEDEGLKRHLRKFEALCKQIYESEEILGKTSIGVDIGEHHVKIPFKILMTRLTSTLDLQIGEQQVSINFRLEPLHDLPLTLVQSKTK